MVDVAILVPAAGASSRMRGTDKLLEPVDGTSALRRAAAMAARVAPRVFVTLPEGGPHAAPRQAELSGLGVTALPLPDAHEGMAASLRAGAAAAGNADGLMILLPDMPDIGEDDLRLLLAVFAEEPACPARLGTPDARDGHPVILPLRLFPGLLVLTGDEGARRVLAGEEVNLVLLDDDRALRDLDTPEDWARWRRLRGQ
ncbi:MAG: NTP transferase domain-containing protein [Rhodobacteraceae bacterium]|nr:NTP transferase domain-containing protein [Paracoccaceae bacterium]